MKVKSKTRSENCRFPSHVSLRPLLLLPSSTTTITEKEVQEEEHERLNSVAINPSQPLPLSVMPFTGVAGDGEAAVCARGKTLVCHSGSKYTFHGMRGRKDPAIDKKSKKVLRTSQSMPPQFINYCYYFANTERRGGKAGASSNPAVSPHRHECIPGDEASLDGMYRQSEDVWICRSLRTSYFFLLSLDLPLTLFLTRMMKNMLPKTTAAEPGLEEGGGERVVTLTLHQNPCCISDSRSDSREKYTFLYSGEHAAGKSESREKGIDASA